MKIPLAYVNNYDKAITQLTEKARAEIAPKLTRIDLTDVALAREAIITLLDTYLRAYTDAAATISANFYALCRNTVLGGSYEPVTDSRRVPEATEKSVKAFMQVIVDGKPPETLYSLCLQRVGYEINKAAADCIYANAEYDPY